LTSSHDELYTSSYEASSRNESSRVVLFISSRALTRFCGRRKSFRLRPEESQRARCKSCVGIKLVFLLVFLIKKKFAFLICDCVRLVEVGGGADECLGAKRQGKRQMRPLVKSLETPVRFIIYRLHAISLLGSAYWLFFSPSLRERRKKVFLSLKDPRKHSTAASRMNLCARGGLRLMKTSFSGLSSFREAKVIAHDELPEVRGKFFEPRCQVFLRLL
jgi:hypothetical protein